MKSKLPLLALCLATAFTLQARADSEVKGPMAFDPLPGSAYSLLTTDPVLLAHEPWLLPRGFRQTIVSDESDLDIYVGNDWNDMNTVNETRRHAGRYLYRTHEVRGGAIGNDGNSRRNDGGSGGAVSVVDLKTGEAVEVVGRADWEALDGLVWTPWHTLLFAEEVNQTSRPDPDYPQAFGGLVYELELDERDPTLARRVSARPLLGSMSHEDIEIDDEGNVYVIDEDRKPNGQIYKFVPEHYGDLSSGKLYALKVRSGQTGTADWVPLTLDPVTFNAEAAAKAAGATGFCRPEDVERIGQVLYVALTCEDVDNPANSSGDGAVLSITLGATPEVRYFVKHGVNVSKENRAAGVTGMKSPDNLANGPDGKLWIIEDNVPSDIWVAEPDHDGDGYADKVSLFASLRDDGAEGSGIYFGKDKQTLFVNILHSVTGKDKTMAITRRK